MSTSSGGPHQPPPAPLAGFLELRAEIAAQRLGDGGPDVCLALTTAVDAALARLAEPFSGQRLAVVAVGGYGRAELCLYSDLDVMLLHAGELPRHAVEALLYPLWDAGLKVGHAVRSVKEALAAASAALPTLTALMDARVVAGDAALVDALFAGLGARFRQGRLRLFDTLAEAERDRRAREPFQLLEADLKTGRGGLRSLQSLHWQRRRQALAGDHPAPAPSRPEQDARAALLSARNALHSAAGRAFERHVFELRPRAAAWVGLDPPAAGRRLYSAMRIIDALAAGCWALPLDPTAAAHRERPRPALRPHLRWRPAGFGAGTTAHAAASPSVSALSLAARALDRSAGAPALTSEEEQTIRAGGSVEWDAADRRSFLYLLASGWRGLLLFNRLESLGWVGRILPEWRHVVAAPQEAPFHLHPVDVHLWRTVIELLAITGPQSDEPWCREAGSELGSLSEALLAALFHDIGKGWAGDHSSTGAVAAAALLRRAHFGPATIGAVSTAVRHHLLLPNTAMRRDIEDPLVVGQVADRAADLQTLRILYLLAVADARATGPSVWNEWKRTLIRSLFARTAAELDRRAGPSAASPAAEAIVEAIEAASHGRHERRLVAEHLQAMPQGYAEAFSIAEIVRHLDAMTPAPQNSAVVDVRAGGPAANAIVVAEDRPGLLATISGVFALHNIAVLEGRFYTRMDGIVLDVFHVADALGATTEPRRWLRVREDLDRAIHGELSLEDLLKEKALAYRRSESRGSHVEVAIDRDAPGRFGVVEVHCGDRIGLLHQIAGALHAAGLDIRMAKVDTRGADVVDTFYVRSAGSDAPPEPERLSDAARDLERRLRAVP